MKEFTDKTPKTEEQILDEYFKDNYPGVSEEFKEQVRQTWGFDCYRLSVRWEEFKEQAKEYMD